MKVEKKSTKKTCLDLQGAILAKAICNILMIKYITPSVLEYKTSNIQILSQ